MPATSASINTAAQRGQLAINLASIPEVIPSGLEGVSGDGSESKNG